MMDNAGMSTRQKCKCPTRANDIHCLPQAVQYQHGLVEHSIHTDLCGIGRSMPCQGGALTANL